MSGSDGSTTWMDRATMRGLALGFVLNFLLSSLAWVDLFDYYDVRVAASTMAAQTLAASWFILQVTRRRFRLTDFQAVLVVHIAVLTVLLVAHERSPAPPGANLTLTQGWSVAIVCGCILLLPPLRAGVAVLVVTALSGAIRSAFVPVPVAVTEAVIPIVGALITAWAGASATRRFARAEAAHQLALQAGVAADEAQARSDARAWWDRVLHDKVLGALVLTSRATSSSMLQNARLLAADALDVIETVEAIDEFTRGERPDLALDGSKPPATPAAVGSLDDRLGQLAASHGLTGDVSIRGRGTPPEVQEAVLAAADQALRNVALHSGVTSVRIRGHQLPARLSIDIRDRGRGFEVHEVEARRAGLSQSIPGHMALVGGTSRVRSTPGRGTRVTLAWRPTWDGESGAPISARQLRRWWWVTAAYAGLHALGGWLTPGPMMHGVLGWAGLTIWLVALVMLHSNVSTERLTQWLAAVLLGNFLMLAPVPLPLSSGWTVWFLAASYPALCIPALRGRPWASAVGGSALALAVVIVFTIRYPTGVGTALQMAAPLAVIPAIAALYAWAMSRADKRLHEAQRSMLDARRRLRQQEARHDLVSDRVRTVADGTWPLFHKLLSGDVLTAQDRRLAHLLESINRDHLMARDVLTPPLEAQLRLARLAGVTVHLTSASVRTETRAAPAPELLEFRRILADALTASQRGDEITARWQPENSYAAGTIVVEPAAAESVTSLFTVPARPKLSVAGGGLPATLLS